MNSLFLTQLALCKQANVMDQIQQWLSDPTNQRIAGGLGGAALGGGLGGLLGGGGGALGGAALGGTAGAFTPEIRGLIEQLLAGQVDPNAEMALGGMLPDVMGDTPGLKREPLPAPTTPLTGPRRQFGPQVRPPALEQPAAVEQVIRGPLPDSLGALRTFTPQPSNPNSAASTLGELLPDVMGDRLGAARPQAGPRRQFGPEPRMPDTTQGVAFGGDALASLMPSVSEPNPTQDPSFRQLASMGAGSVDPAALATAGQASAQGRGLDKVLSWLPGKPEEARSRRTADPKRYPATTTAEETTPPAADKPGLMDRALASILSGLGERDTTTPAGPPTLDQALDNPQSPGWWASQKARVPANEWQTRLDQQAQNLLPSLPDY